MRSLWLVAGYCCATSLQAATLIHAGQLIDVANAQVDKNKTIVVENNRKVGVACAIAQPWAYRLP